MKTYTVRQCPEHPYLTTTDAPCSYCRIVPQVVTLMTLDELRAAIRNDTDYQAGKAATLAFFGIGQDVTPA